MKKKRHLSTDGRPPSHTMLQAHEDSREYEAFLRELMDCVKPEDAIEKVIVRLLLVPPARTRYHRSVP